MGRTIHGKRTKGAAPPKLPTIVASSALWVAPRHSPENL